MTTAPTLAGISVRRADAGDIVILAHQRIAMFRDMGQLTEHNERELTTVSESFFRVVLASGEYITWLALAGISERIIAGAGLWLRPMLPRPTPTGVIQGREALIANVYTEPEWRRRGVAALLMRHVLDYTRTHDIPRVLLHASDDGRPLYESMGFVSTNEMRLVENH